MSNKKRTKEQKLPKVKKRLKPSSKSGGKIKITPFSKETVRVIIGRKEELFKKRMVTISVCAVLLVAFLVFSLITPTGPFEYLQTAVHSIGSGSFPANVSGSKVLNVNTIGSDIYILTDTHSEIFTSSGKKLFSRQHEFNSPVFSVAGQRAIIYDRGGKSAFVYNSSDVLYELSFKNDIYCASMGRNGTYAVATKSDSYASQVEVFSKNRKSKFTWFSSDSLINSVAVSDNGRRIAVSTVDTNSGQYKSKIYVFEFTKPDPVYTIEYADRLIYSINTVSGSRFSVVTAKGVDYISWLGGRKTTDEKVTSVNSYHFKKNGSNIVVSGNKTNSTISIYDRRGKNNRSFDFNGTVSDISAVTGRVFILSDGYLYMTDNNGKVLADKINMAGYSRIVAVGANTVIAVGNYGINRITFNK